MRRRTLVVIVGLALTGMLGWKVTHQSGVYTAAAVVTFLPPQGGTFTNPWQGANPNLVATAGIVSKAVGEGAGGGGPVSDDVGLLGQGVTSGYSLRLPNHGGQWTNNFDRPELDLQVAAKSSAQAKRRLEQLVGSVSGKLAELQKNAGVASRDMIRTSLTPPNPMVRLSTGSRSRAAAAALAVGSMLTFGAVVTLEYASAYRRRLKTG